MNDQTSSFIKRIIALNNLHIHIGTSGWSYKHWRELFYPLNWLNSGQELKNFAKKLRRWVKEGHEVWAYFNNDIYSYATGDAKGLQFLIEQQRATRLE